MLDQIANEMLIASHLLKTNNVSRIAEGLGYRPILIINALYRARESGKLTYDKKKDIITASEDVEIENLAVTEGMNELIEQIEVLAQFLAGEEKDMSIPEMQLLLGGTPELHIKLAVYASPRLTTYEIADPKDKKSVYTFVTLKENAAHKWGQKQFVSKASKVAKRVAEEAKAENK
jgi:hypothetical protein